MIIAFHKKVSQRWMIVSVAVESLDYEKLVPGIHGYRDRIPDSGGRGIAFPVQRIYAQ